MDMVNLSNLKELINNRFNKEWTKMTFNIFNIYQRI